MNRSLSAARGHRARVGRIAGGVGAREPFGDGRVADGDGQTLKVRQYPLRTYAYRINGLGDKSPGPC